MMECTARGWCEMASSDWQRIGCCSSNQDEMLFRWNVWTCQSGLWTWPSDVNLIAECWYCYPSDWKHWNFNASQPKQSILFQLQSHLWMEAVTNWPRKYDLRFWAVCVRKLQLCSLVSNMQYHRWLLGATVRQNIAFSWPDMVEQ